MNYWVADGRQILIIVSCPNLALYSCTGWPKKNRYGHFHSYLTTAFEFFDNLNTKKITDKFLINSEKMAVRRGLSEFLHGLKVDAIFKWINRVQFD